MYPIGRLQNVKSHAVTQKRCKSGSTLGAEKGSVGCSEKASKNLRCAAVP